MTYRIAFPVLALNRIRVVSIVLVAAACGGSDGGTPPQEQPASVTVSPATVATFASIGQTTALAGQVQGTNGSVLSNVTISWTTLNGSVASVSPASGSSSTVTSTGNGATKIIATISITNGARSDTVDVTVQQAFAALLVTPATVNLLVDGTQQLTASLVDALNVALALPGLPTPTFTSGNTAVADVSPTGLVTAKANGNATITASATFGGVTKSAARAVVVAPRLSQIFDVGSTANTFVNGNPVIHVGDQVRFTIQVFPHNVLFSSNPPVELDIGSAGVGVAVGTVALRTFNTAGTSNYVCDLHNGMTGTITVIP